MSACALIAQDIQIIVNTSIFWEKKNLKSKTMRVLYQSIAKRLTEYAGSFSLLYYLI